MLASALVLNLCFATASVPDRLPPSPKIAANIEGKWLDVLRREGRLTIPLKDGKLEFSAGGVKERNLLSAVIKRYDGARNLEYMIWAKEAEIRLDTDKKGQLLLHVRQCEFLSADGSGSGYVESRIVVFEFAMPAQK